jgi:peptidoglycan/LPS O-acetylase OafA/YrhL
VVLHHAKVDFFPNGYLGVDVFFVISGFLIVPKIVHILESDLNIIQVNRIQKLKNFYLRRFLRLTPAFSIFIIFNLILTLGLGSVFSYKDNVFQSLLGLIGLGNVGSHIFAPDYFNSIPSSANHIWSLSVEEQFYLLIPIFALLLAKIRINIWLTMISVISFIAFLHGFQGNESNYFLSSYYSPVLRLWEFILGGLIAINKLRLKNHLKLFSLLFVIVMALLPQVKISERVAIVSIVLGTCIFLISDQMKRHNPLLEKILAWIGDRSYSIYLYHLPLIFLTRHSPYISDFPRSISMSIALILTFVLGDLSFRFVEKKFNVKYIHQSFNEL